MSNILLEEDMDKNFQDIFKDIPNLLFRSDHRIKELTGKTTRTWANLDARGVGIQDRVKIGRAVAYPRKAIIKFLSAQLTTP